MDAKRAKELLPIITAFANGKKIQYFEMPGVWNDNETLTFEMPPENYRIKPQPKLVPFTFEDNLLFRDKWIKHKGSSKDLNKIVRVCSGWICIENLETPILYESLLDIFEFEDGSPCGKYVNE